MKYKIAVIDDEQEYLDFISTQISKFKNKENVDFDIHCFLTGKAFLENNQFDFDIVFLDINMPEINGLTTATQFRAVNNSSLIIFSTHYAQYAIDGYTVNAFAFLIKPIPEAIFQNTLAKAVQRITRMKPINSQISLNTGEGIHLVNVSDILYIEVQRHTLFYYILKNDKVVSLRVYGTMKEVAARFKKLYFENCSACYLVNLKHVSAIIKKNIELRGGIILPISRQFFKCFVSQFMEYVKESGAKNA